MPTAFDPERIAGHRRLLMTRVVGGLSVLPELPVAQGAVYLARERSGAIKIGFSKRPAGRIHELGLLGELVISGASRKHEQALHRRFVAEHVAREFFSGPRIEAFIASMRAVSRLTLADLPSGRWYLWRVRDFDARAKTRAA